MNKILIKIEGGLIQTVGISDPNTQVVIIDYDAFADATLEDSVDDIADRAVFFADTYEMEGDKSFAAQMFGELNEEEEAVKRQLEIIDENLKPITQ